jgi:hypothetical protein
MTQGYKLDDGKPRYDLLPDIAMQWLLGNHVGDSITEWTLLRLIQECGGFEQAVAMVVKVLEKGLEKYPPYNWVTVPEGERRYVAARNRHLVACVRNRGALDDESGLPHLAHALCCCIFLMYLENEV